MKITLQRVFRALFLPGCEIKVLFRVRKGQTAITNAHEITSCHHEITKHNFKREKVGFL